MKEKDMKDAFLEFGKKKGVITCEELNDAMPAEYFPLEELEGFLRRLENLGVKVVIGKEQFRRKKQGKTMRSRRMMK